MTELDEYSARKMVATSKNLYFEKKGPKVKEHLHLNFLTIFHKKGQRVLKPCSYGPGDTSTHNSHFMGKRRLSHPEKKIILHGDMKSVSLIIFLVQNIITSDNRTSM